MESTMISTSKPEIIAGSSLEQWNAAHVRVVNYFTALRVPGKARVGELASHVIERAMRRAGEEPGRPAMAIAADEMDRMVTEWFASVLDDPRNDNDPMLSVRGRLAMLLANMPGKWQEQFLQPGPWPAEFVQAMRDSYLHSGPDLQHAQMSPRPLDLGPIASLTKLGD